MQREKKQSKISNKGGGTNSMHADALIGSKDEKD